jgi:hypothetical protein
MKILPAAEPAEGKGIVIARAPTGRRGHRYEATASTPNSETIGRRHRLRFGSILAALQQAMT